MLRKSTRPRIKLFKSQMELLTSRERLVAFVAGYGTGKTHAECVKALQLAAANPGLIGLFIEPTYPMVKMIAMRDLERTCKLMGIRCRVRVADKLIYVLVGSPRPQWTPIYFMSAENPESLNGPTVAWIILDEAGQCKEEIPDKLIARLRDPKASLSQMIIAGTPQGGPGTWFGQWAEFGPKKQRVDRLIRGVTAENTFLKPEYLDTMRNKFNEEEFDCYCKGLFVAAGGQVYRYDSLRNLRKAPKTMHNLPGKIQIFADFNVAKVVWLLAHVHNGVVHVFDEVASVSTYTDEQAVKVKKRLAQWQIEPYGLTVYHDANVSKRSLSATRDGTSSSDVIEVKKAGFYVRANRKNPPVRDRILSVNDKLKGGTLFVDPRCTEMIKSLSTQGRDAAGQPDKSGGLDHAADALGYGIHWQWPVKMPGNPDEPNFYH